MRGMLAAMAPIRAGIVGLGRWGRALVDAVAGNSDDIRFTLGFTRTAETAREFCRQRRIALVGSYDDICAVRISTPSSLRRRTVSTGSQALSAIAAKKHVFVEKPLTLDFKSALGVAEAAAEAGLVLAVGLTRRFHPSVAELRLRIADGRLGDIVAMVAQHTTSTAQFIAPDNWRAAPQKRQAARSPPSACMCSTT